MTSSINTIIYPILILLFIACSDNKPPLNAEEFTSLLIDLHIADGTLSASQINISEKENTTYTYYNWIYNKYNITESQFDSCVIFYVAQPEVYLKIYDDVLDSLNKLVTHHNQILQSHKSNDSLNLFPFPEDTLYLTQKAPTRHFVIDSLTSGYYSFSAYIKFDKQEQGKNNKITSMFISEDDSDTLHVKDIFIAIDTVRARKYNWKQYIDSAYNRLEITIFQSDNAINISDRHVRVWGINLFKPYISEKTKAEMQNSLNTKRGRNTSTTTNTENRLHSRRRITNSAVFDKSEVIKDTPPTEK